MTAKSIIPKPRKRRHRLVKRHNKSGGKTLGQVYAPHSREALERIDLLEIARWLRATRGEIVAKAIVAAYVRLRQQATTPRLTPIKLPVFKNLDQPTKWFLYTAASHEKNLPLTHRITLHLTDDDVQIAFHKDNAPVEVIGEFLNDRLDPVYRHAGHKMRYAYKLEIHRAPIRDEHGRITGRSDLDSYHASIGLFIPNKEIKDGIDAAVARQAVMLANLLPVYANGQRAHIAAISEVRSFTKGEDQTGRSGVLGMGDYAAKDFRRLHDQRQYYLENSPDPMRLNRVAFASEDLRKAARELYGELKALARSTWEEIWAALAGKPAILPPGALFSGYMVDEQVERIIDSDPRLRFRCNMLRTEDDVRRFIASVSS